MNRWHWLSFLLWMLALVLAYWTLTRLPLNDIVAQLGLLSLADWLLWSLVNIAILYVAVKRWKLLGQALQATLSLTRLFRIRLAGNAVSFLTPGPHFGGEPLQLYWLYRHFDVSMHRAVGMLGLDRFMETGTNIAVLLAGVLILLGTTILPVSEWLQISAILAGVLCLMLFFAALFLRHPEWLANRFRPLVKSVRGSDTGTQAEPAKKTELTGWQSLVGSLREALSSHRPRLWAALLLSLAGWGALLVELALLLGFLGLTVSPSDIILIMVGMRLAMLLPVPGGIGTVEASILWSFQFLGLSVSAAVGLIALIRLRDALVLLIGLGCLWSFHSPGFHSKPALAE